MNEKVKSVLNSVLEKFETGDIPEAMAYSMFPFPAVPSAEWSLFNRTLQFLHATIDSRGIRQWKRVNEDIEVKRRYEKWMIFMTILRTGLRMAIS